MYKAYVWRWKNREQPDDFKIDYWFTPDPESAAYWGTKEEAEADCTIFDRHRIELDSAEGGAYVCRDFRSEELRPGRFVIFCEIPLIRQTSGHSRIGESKARRFWRS
jgi:hypothetical protein